MSYRSAKATSAEKGSVDAEGTAEVQGTSTAQEAYESDLRELRQDLGCTPERLRERTALWQGLRARLDGRGERPTDTACVTELRALVEQVADPQHKAALLVAFRLDGNHQERWLKDRRASYSLTLPPRDRRDRRTLQRWEDRAIKRVAQLLCDEEADTFAPPVASDIAFQDAKRRSALVTVRMTNTTFFNNGIATHRDTVRWVKSNTPTEQSLLATQAIYLTEDRPGLIEVEPLFGCRVNRSHRAAGGTVITIYETYKGLTDKDGLYPLAHRTTMHATQPTDPASWWESTEPDTSYYEARLIFQGCLRPSRAWWFVEPTASYGQIEPDPSEGRHLELLDEGRYIYKIFEPIQHYCAHGFAWVWGDRPDD